MYHTFLIAQYIGRFTRPHRMTPWFYYTFFQRLFFARTVHVCYPYWHKRLVHCPIIRATLEAQLFADYVRRYIVPATPMVTHLAPDPFMSDVDFSPVRFFVIIMSQANGKACKEENIQAIGFMAALSSQMTIAL